MLFFTIAIVSDPCFCFNSEIVLGEENQLSSRTYRSLQLIPVF